MRRRLWGFALVLVIAVAPLAPVMCGLTCASHDIPDMAAHSEHHSCHESSTTAATAVPLPHTCGHDSDGSIAAQELIQILVSAGPIERPMNALALIDAAAEGVRSMTIEHSPPGLPALTTPLRV